MKCSPFIAAAALLACSLTFTSCAHKRRVPIAKAPRIGSTESGIASWYGIPYHGRRAANGEIYDMEKLTAAHRTLPFGTWVRVKNLTNDKSVEVRIQDRGPFIEKRIIDLSRAAAREIEMLGPGTAKVRITVIRAPRNPPEPTVAVSPVPKVEVPQISTGKGEAAAPVVEPELYAVQIGAFQDQRRAEALRDAMRQKLGAARIVLRQGSPSLWRVLVGEEETMEKASALAEQLRSGETVPFVVRLDQP